MSQTLCRIRARFTSNLSAVLMAVVVATATVAWAHSAGESPGAPSVGAKAPDFSLASLDGDQVQLSDELKHGPVVLILLRGWPGYQCPFCTRQFGDFLLHAKEIEATGAQVIFIYPGPSDQLKEHAEQFRANRDLPPNFRFLIDPDYAFTSAYGLRWNAPGETSYPSTFVIDKSSTVRFALISRTHDGRAAAADVLKALSALDR